MAAISEAIHQKAIGGLNWNQVAYPRKVTSTAADRFPVFVAPYNCEIVHIFAINSTLVSGADTNTVHMNFIDGGAEGAGTTEISNRDLVSGTDLPAGKTDISPAAEHFMSLGDILELEMSEEGTGLGVDIPELVILVGYRPANLAS